MTIQLSVLIWTVISFCILMLLLNKLLFKPLLTFMDARQAKIDSAYAAREASRKAAADAAKAAEQARLDNQKRVRDEAHAALDAARALAAADASRQERAYEALLIQEKASIETEKQSILRELNAGMDELVALYTGKLLQ